MTNQDKIKEVYLQNKSYAITGRIFDLTRQRIHQIVKDYKNIGTQNRQEKYDKKLVGKKCYICKKLSAILLHHKDFNNKNDKLNNLIPCCKDCHVLLHVNYREKIGYYNGKHKQCSNCGKKFHRNIFQVKSLCMMCFQRKKHNFKEVIYCKNCGKGVFRDPTKKHHKRDYCDYCSTIIYKKQRSFNKITCTVCKNEFYPFKNLKYSKPKKNYCTKECYFRRGNKTGG